MVDGGDSETDLGEVHHCELHHPNGLPRKAVYHSLGLHRSLLAPSLERDREERLGGERERGEGRWVLLFLTGHSLTHGVYGIF